MHLGNGDNMGTYTFADTDTTISFGAANVTVIGGRYLAGISEVVIGLDITADADYLTILGAEFPEPTTSTFEFNIAIQMVTGADDVTIAGCTAYSADATGADHWFNGGAGVCNRLTLVGNVVHGEFAIAPIYSDQIDLENYIAGNTVQNMTSAQFAIEYTAAATGSYGNNWIYTDAEATSIDPGEMKAVAPNWIVTAINASPVMFPAQDDTAQNLIGVDSSNNAAATTSVAANSDGSILERLEQIDVDTSAVAVDTAAQDTPAKMQVLVEGGIRCAEVTISSIATVTDLFAITGGPIIIRDIVGVVTTDIVATGCLINYNIDPTTPATDTVFGTDGTALEINNDDAGSVYIWDGVIAADLTVATNGVVLTQGTDIANGLLCPIGMLELAATATNAGVIKFYLVYSPLSPLSVVTAQ